MWEGLHISASATLSKVSLKQTLKNRDHYFLLIPLEHFSEQAHKLQNSFRAAVTELSNTSPNQVIHQ